MNIFLVLTNSIREKRKSLDLKREKRFHLRSLATVKVMSSKQFDEEVYEKAILSNVLTMTYV